MHQGAGGESEQRLDVLRDGVLRQARGLVLLDRLRDRLGEFSVVEEADRLLGWEYMIEGVVVRGDARGRRLGFATANIEIHDSRCVPAAGVYAGEAHLEHRVLPAVTYVGDIPTFGHEEEGKQRIEVHIPGWEDDLYDYYLGISFRRKLRGEQTFPDAQALKKQISEDVKHALE